MLDEVKRVAPLWNPMLDDGVVLTMAPLWRLVPYHKPWQKELKGEVVRARCRKARRGRTSPCISGPNVWYQSVRHTATLPSPMGSRASFGLRVKTGSGSLGPPRRAPSQISCANEPRLLSRLR